MGYNFRPYDQETLYLLPPSIADWVAEGSLARFVNDVVEHLDGQGRLKGIYSSYRADGWGAAAFHPKMMVKVLLYAYSQGVSSSRKIAWALENDVSFRYLSANEQVDFRTIALFRSRHLKVLEGLFVEILRLCKEAGLVKMNRVALDGHKVAANAALDANRTLEALTAEREKIASEVKRMLEAAEQTDRMEDAQFGPDVRGDELPEGLRTKNERLARIAAAQRRLQEAEQKARQTQAEKIEQRAREQAQTGRKKRGRKPKDPEAAVNKQAKANMTDPDSRIMKGRHGYVQAYNGQAVVDCESQVIVAQALTQDENDVAQLAPMLERCEKQAGERPKEAVADAGYWSESNAKLGSETTQLFVATTKDWKQRKALREKGVPQHLPPDNATLKERMEHKLLTEYGRAAYKQRSATVEPVFGQMITRGLVRFVLRGVGKVSAEWSLWCTTHNLLKLWRSGFVPSVKRVGAAIARAAAAPNGNDRLQMQAIAAA
jgi:transposase